MDQSSRRERLREKLHTLRWYLVVGSGTAFGALFVIIFGSAASASSPATPAAQTQDVSGDQGQVQQPASQQPASQQPQVSNANPYYPPLVRTRRS